MDPIISVWVTLLSPLVSVIGALVAIYISVYKIKPEARKLDADTSSSIADAADTIATGARVTIEMLNGLREELEQQLRREREDGKNEITLLKAELLEERRLRVILQDELVVEREVRKKVERKIAAYQRYINVILGQMAEAKMQPVAFEWVDDT